MPNRRRGIINPPTAPAPPIASPVVPILVSISNFKDSDVLVFVLIQPMSEDVITPSYSKGGGSNTSSGEVNMAPRFRTLGHKKSKASFDPLVVLDPPIA